jgi:hypothetical protein
MQFHQGTRLKKYIDESPYSQKKICELTETPTSSLQDLFKKDEIVNYRFKAILNFLEVSVGDFFKDNFYQSRDEKILNEIEALKKENIKLLNDKVNLQAQIIELQKGLKKTRIVA